jgi:hypothetical protein
MKHFPLDGSILHWCPNNDMVYYRPTEGIEDDVDGIVGLFPFREFKKLLVETEDCRLVQSLNIFLFELFG